MRRHCIHLAAALGCLILVTGCAHGPEIAPAATGTAAAECEVCKSNNDLACVDVVVDETTPRYEHHGKTHYFCSNACRNEFAKNPAKFAEK